ALENRAQSAETAETALEAALALDSAMSGSGPVETLLSVLTSAIDLGRQGGASPGLMARAVNRRLDPFRPRGGPAHLEAPATEARQLAKLAGDLVSEGRALHSLAVAMWLQNRIPDAEAHAEQAAILHRQASAFQYLAVALNMSAMCAFRQGRN